MPILKRLIWKLRRKNGMKPEDWQELLTGKFSWAKRMKKKNKKE
jgi:hypothetical protein